MTDEGVVVDEIMWVEDEVAPLGLSWQQPPEWVDEEGDR